MGSDQAFTETILPASYFERETDMLTTTLIGNKVNYPPPKGSGLEKASSLFVGDSMSLVD